MLPAILIPAAEALAYAIAAAAIQKLVKGDDSRR